MTANRWWVRRAARWLARFDTTKSQLQALSLAITAFSTFSILLQNAGYGSYVPYVGTIGASGWLVYTYYYAEGGVHNQKQRDMVDLSDDYSSPTMLMNKKLEAQQLAYLGALLSGEDFETVVTQMDDLTESEWSSLRDGVIEE